MPEPKEQQKTQRKEAVAAGNDPEQFELTSFGRRRKRRPGYAFWATVVTVVSVPVLFLYRHLRRLGERIHQRPT